MARKAYLTRLEKAFGAPSVCLRLDVCAGAGAVSHRDGTVVDAGRLEAAV